MNDLRSLTSDYMQATLEQRAARIDAGPLPQGARSLTQCVKTGGLVAGAVGLAAMGYSAQSWIIDHANSTTNPDDMDARVTSYLVGGIAGVAGGLMAGVASHSAARAVGFVGAGVGVATLGEALLGDRV